MKRRFVAVLLSLCLILAFIPVSAMAVEFDDAQGHWAEAAIDRWSDAGVVSGVASAAAGAAPCADGVSPALQPAAETQSSSARQSAAARLFGLFFFV